MQEREGGRAARPGFGKCHSARIRPWRPGSRAPPFYWTMHVGALRARTGPSWPRSSSRAPVGTSVAPGYLRRGGGRGRCRCGPLSRDTSRRGQCGAGKGPATGAGPACWQDVDRPERGPVQPASCVFFRRALETVPRCATSPTTRPQIRWLDPWGHEPAKVPVRPSRGTRAGAADTYTTSRSPSQSRPARLALNARNPNGSAVPVRATPRGRGTRCPGARERHGKNLLLFRGLAGRSPKALRSVLAQQWGRARTWFRPAGVPPRIPVSLTTRARVGFLKPAYGIVAPTADQGWSAPCSCIARGRNGCHSKQVPARDRSCGRLGAPQQRGALVCEVVWSSVLLDARAESPESEL